MSFWSKIKGPLNKIAGFLLPVLAQSALEKFRKKNPKYGWLVDAVEGSISHVEANELTASLPLTGKVELIAQTIVNDFPGTDLNTAREVARLVLSHRQGK